jgi:DNA repair protein RecO (recombination protein O)
MNSRRAVQKQPAYILTRHPYSESSLIVDAFTRDFGRVALLAKGARRLKSPFRGVLQGFQPLVLSWSGSRDLVTLVRAEPAPVTPTLGGRTLMFGWYANELLLRFLQRKDPHENLFDAYASLLTRLRQGGEHEWFLRLFEIALLRDIGYGMVLDRAVEGNQPIESGRRYRYIPDRGPVPEDDPGQFGMLVTGATLMALRGDLSVNDAIGREARRLTRKLLENLLEGRELRSRGVYRQMFVRAEAGDAGGGG